MTQMLFIVFFTLCLGLRGIFGEWNQSSTEKDYVPDLKFISLENVNKSLIGSNHFFNFSKINRTQFVLNVEFDLLQDLDGNKLQIISEMYVLLNNQYKFSGIRHVKNACQLWKENVFFLRNILRKYTNIEPCNVVKKHYYVRDFVLDTFMYPKSLPLGSFKGVISTQLDGNEILRLAYFLRMNYYASWQKETSNRLNIRVFKRHQLNVGI